MLIGSHVLLYSENPEADRAFFRDILNFPFVDVGHGWLIFKLPASEAALHPADDGKPGLVHGGHRLIGASFYLMCDDLEMQIKVLKSKRISCTEVEEESWGIRTTIKLPSGGEIGLYQPKHPTALSLSPRPGTVQRILAAASFAAEKHAGQKRKGRAEEPYINHLIEVAELITASSDVLDTNLVMAGLLHDTIEDTGVTARELEERFGSDIASLVMEATDDKSLPKETRKALQVKNAPHKSRRAQTLKLADKVSNLRSLLHSPPAEWSSERKRQYCEWARQVVSGFTSPNPFLMAEFDKAYAELARSVKD